MRVESVPELLVILRCSRCGRLLGKCRHMLPVQTTFGGMSIEIVCPDSRCHAYNQWDMQRLVTESSALTLQVEAGIVH